MNRKPYAPPCTYTICLQDIHLLTVTSADSDDVNWSSQGFSESDEDR